MSSKRCNNLVVIENGLLTEYVLDDKLTWYIGRGSKDKVIDIKLHTKTISREHGKIKNMGGTWFFVDNNGKNGTIYNGEHICTGILGKIKPKELKDKDVLIFGGGKEPVINSNTVWSIFLEYRFEDEWTVVDTKGMLNIQLLVNKSVITLINPGKGTVIEGEEGIAIYMGDITYICGDISVKTKE